MAPSSAGAQRSVCAGEQLIKRKHPRFLFHADVIVEIESVSGTLQLVGKWQFDPCREQV